MATRTAVAALTATWAAAAAACAAPRAGDCGAQALAGVRQPLTATNRQALTAADVVLERVVPDRLIPGTRVRLRGANLAGEQGTTPEVVVDGEFTAAGAPGRPVTLPVAVEVGDDGEVSFVVDEAFAQALGATEGDFAGSVSLRTYVGAPPAPVVMAAAWRFTLQRTLVPELFEFNFGSPDLWPADAVSVDGDGFLLPGEGETRVILEGRFVAEGQAGGGAPRTHEGALVVDDDRRRGHLLLLPEVMPPTQGELRAVTVRLVNVGVDGVHTAAATTLDTTLRMNPPFVGGFSPHAPGRGQRLQVHGRGFLPDPATLFRLDGLFHPDGGAPREIAGLLVSPDRWIDGSLVEMGLLTQMGEDGTLTGLSAQPGRLEGSVTPVLVTDAGDVEGLPWDGGFIVGATLQKVWLRYLPTFVDSLQSLFGLGAVEHQVRARVAEVIRRDYADFNIEFGDERPEGFDEFSIIEVGGPDPNNLGLFGLDNTMGKDTGNIRLDDIVAGANSESAGAGFPGYGGVFVESFIAFSPRSPEPLPVASDRFDEVFAPFAPFLCGEPVTAAEAIGTGREGIAEAVRVFGNVVGSTVVHEVGHSLGLTQAVAGDGAFHNLGDNGNIMDSGTDRSLGERAEIDGEGPSTWHPLNYDYLSRILPRPGTP